MFLYFPLVSWIVGFISAILLFLFLDLIKQEVNNNKITPRRWPITPH